MKKVISHFYLRVSTFYRKFIREKDEFMVHYYSAVALGALLYFYIHFVLILIHKEFEIEILKWGYLKYTIIFVSILVSSVIYFFKEQKHFKEYAKISRKKFKKLDIVLILYVMEGLFFMYYNAFSV